MVKLPKGIKEEDFLEVLEKAVADATRNFGVAYLEIEDLKQEARTFALEALPKFKAAKGSLYTFLRTHIHNRLINLKRDIEFRPQAPCHSCGYHDPATLPSDRTGCAVYEDRSQCIRWMRWMKANSAKRNLSSPSPESNDSSESRNDNEDMVLDDVLKRELKGLISHRIPNSLRADYLKMIDGVSLPIKRRSKVLEVLKRILIDEGNVYGGE